MDKYYHFTSYDCIDSIKSNGLIPQNGFRCKSIGDSSCGVFFSKGMDQSIIMYALMLGFYEKYVGNEGDRIYQESLLEIQELENNEKCNIRKNMEIKRLNSIIERVKLVKNCGSFTNYLSGDGCFLSVDNLNVDCCMFLSNCCCGYTIPPEKINVVGVVNRFTNIYTDLREAVLSYFMYIFPIEDVLKLLPDENHSLIYRLYEYIFSLGCTCNPYYYNLIETPISSYDCGYQNVKTLVY